MEREVQAVDSEFNQVLQNDSCRLQQLQCHTSAPGHPFNQFFWGNKKSLVDAMEKGINLREQILKLYNEYYHGELMKLVVIGGDKSVIPKSVNDTKIIHAGKVLENSKTLAESGLHIGDLPGGVITMHVVVQPPVAKKKTDKNKEFSKQSTCSCTIL